MPDFPPADFDSYWQRLLDDLAALPIAAEETELPLRSDEHCICYAVRLTSWGPYRIFGYLCVPRQHEGPFPAYYYLPRYQSVVEVVQQGDAVDKRRECVTFSIACRGQRNADRPLIGEFPGMLTTGVEDRWTYPLRGWVADCIRGLQYLLSRPEVDPARVAGVGYNDFSLLTAALQPGLCCVTSRPGLFYRTRELPTRGTGYPLEEIGDYVRTAADGGETLYATFSYFDPLWFAQRIDSPCLLWAERDYALRTFAELKPLADRLGGTVELRSASGSRSLDGIYEQQWLAAHLGLRAPVLPEHWRSRD